MSVIQDVTKSVDTTPLYAVVGVTDLAVEKVRDARVRAIAARTELAAQIAPAKVQGRATDAFTAVKELPSLAINQGVDGRGALRLFNLVGEGLVAAAEFVKARRQRHVYPPLTGIRPLSAPQFHPFVT